MVKSQKAVGIIRVSHVGGREGERFVSPTEQRERIAAACEREGFELLEVHEELDVSGGKPLDERPDLSAAVAAIEAGRATVLVAAYFDRLFRSLTTQADVIERVEAAGGQVLAVDVGQVTSASAGQWLSGTMLGAVAEYFRRSAKERSAEGQAKALARGASLKRHVPLGYRRRDDGTLEPDDATRSIVGDVFEARAAGQSGTALRKLLASHGIERSDGGIRKMLANRVYLGEMRFGEMVNPAAHDPIIDISLFERVQATKIPRGPAGKSDHLLARLRVLRCATCDTPLAPATDLRDGYRLYRHPSTSCDQPVTISATVAEHVVATVTRAALLDVHGRASITDEARRLDDETADAQAALDTAIRTFTAAGIMDEASAIEELAELRRVRDEKVRRRVQLGPQPEVTVDTLDDWDDMPRDVQRALIRSTVDRATVCRGGKGADRISVVLRGQPSASLGV